MKAKINNKTFINFDEVSIESSLDSIASTFTLSAFFDIDDPEHQKVFKPLSYNKIEIFNDDDSLALTGTVLNHDFDSSSVTELATLSGYSLPGVLEDCNIPYSMYPLESLKMNLREVSQKVIKPFGLTLLIDSSVSGIVNQVYPKTVCAPEDSIKDYLSRLAAQRNIILSHNEKGQLLMFRPNIKANSVAVYSELNSLSIQLGVSGQGFHSKMTILRQPKMKKKPTLKNKDVNIPPVYDDNGYEVEPPKVVVKTIKKRPKPQFYDTIENPMIEAFRPSVRKMSEGEDISTENAVKNYMADELRNIKFVINLERWDNVKPGDIIEVESRRLFLNKKSRLMIESISKEQNSESKTMVINAVLPETFTGDIPKNIFL